MGSLINSRDRRTAGGISEAAKTLIEKFENRLLLSLKTDRFRGSYKSIDDILAVKYKLRDIENMDFPRFEKKSEFITRSVRGNIQKAEGKILTYQEADEIVHKALNEELP